jgi:hypothetical protein
MFALRLLLALGIMLAVVLIVQSAGRVLGA